MNNSRSQKSALVTFKIPWHQITFTKVYFFAFKKECSCIENKSIFFKDLHSVMMTYFASYIFLFPGKKKSEQRSSVLFNDTLWYILYYVLGIEFLARFITHEKDSHLLISSPKNHIRCVSFFNWIFGKLNFWRHFSPGYVEEKIFKQLLRATFVVFQGLFFVQDALFAVYEFYPRDGFQPFL